MLDWLFQSPGSPKPLWLELLPLVITVCLAVYGYWRVQKVWKKQKRAEMKIWAGQQRESARISACKAAWGLLSYMSDRESDKMIFVPEGKKSGNPAKLRIAPSKEFLNEVEKVIFEDGHGIFLSEDVHRSIYSFRNMVYKIMDASRYGAGIENIRNIETDITLDNAKIYEGRERIFVELKTQLLKEIGKNPAFDIDTN